MQRLYTHRTELETYVSRCQRACYFAYHLPVSGASGPPREDELPPEQLVPGAGLASVTNAIETTFGSATHLGVQVLLSGGTYDNAIKAAQNYYQHAVTTTAIVDRHATTEEALDYSLAEHYQLLEALLYTWYLTEYKELKENYQILIVEQEMENTLAVMPNYRVPVTPDKFLLEPASVILQSRVDAVLLAKSNYELSTYSLKTIKQPGFFSEMMQNRELQGYLEIFAMEQWLEKVREAQRQVLEEWKDLPQSMRAAIAQYLSNKVPLDITQVDRVRFCFLVKGDRKTDDVTNICTTENSYLYGYRKENPDGETLYAHSYWYFNPNNLSGTGRLGKGWERFEVWKHYPGGIRAWIDAINAGDIQPDASNPARKVIYTPDPIIRDQNILALTITTMGNARIEIEEKKQRPNPIEHFLPNYKSCLLPTPCEFYPICYEQVDPLTSNLYQIRVNHHGHPR